ncbi:carboxy-terminal kinesin 2 [Nannizzia gypsea CBS 118893]|uniref:Kinesin-like protein n=1 Tax=Arthroderma gypseum (strain ATCC MYA-4604 / CBS 118893) TaxID=535722 RepID=E4UN93_ARTGP|nr:carboxy-terminal kinesin 2 [Nannizzia gypsea CBS 118893]EFQ99554.1 carboxy-terminal kinesin 2 [Nannizzia gypsea CBS 118893]
MDEDDTQGRLASSVSNIPRPKFSYAQPESLKDITHAVNNAGGRATAASGAGSDKKRKTLSERAGEPRKKENLGTRSFTGSTKTALPKSLGVSKTSASRAPTNSSRLKPPPGTRNIPRPQTSIGHLTSEKGSIPRPATSMDGRDAGSSRNGARQPSSIKSSTPSAHPSPSLKPKLPDISISSKSYGSQVDCVSNQLRSSPVLHPSRNPSLCTAMQLLSLSHKRSIDTMKPRTQLQLTTPSKIPTPIRPLLSSYTHSSLPPSPFILKKTRKQRSPRRAKRFLTIDTEVQAWDQDEKEQRISDNMTHVRKMVEEMVKQTAAMTETTDLYKSRTQMLEENQTKLLHQNADLRVELETTKNSLANAESRLKELSREQEIALSELATQHRNQSEVIRQDAQAEVVALRQQHRAELAETRRRFEAEIAIERQLRAQELEQLAAQSFLEKQRDKLDLSNKDREIQDLLAQRQRLHDDLEREHALNKELQQNSIVNSNNTATLESSIRALKAKIEFLESGSKEQSDAFAKLDKELREALEETTATKAQLRKEETLRRRLHNQIQELKGNIRVFCRVRPVLSNDSSENIAKISFPDEDLDCREIMVQGPEEKSSLGLVSAKNHFFAYDHVFGPRSQNAEVFEEISQLVQSALDGYNVCIFCYGQTGSGKTHTMSSEDGMIPRAVRQIYDTASGLEDKGWTYTMEGSFVEVYNENINDLLGRAEEFDKKKHEIRHDLQKCQTTVTNVNTVCLDSPEKVESILQRAWANRSVAATKANERSSRSHSVFILRLVGDNSITGEHSEGTLNLVDLAGSERLSHSGSTGERLKETQNINKSLSCLGDVISALGQGKEGTHIPYRNSKLTYLLQFSLGGNSKTLMFVMVSPQQDHLSETLTSLKFAAKVQNTHVGTAKRQTRMRDS